MTGVQTCALPIYGSSIALTGGPEVAFQTFFVFYLLCIGITWWHYARKNAAMPC